MNAIQVFCINLRKRVDRRFHIQQEFKGRKEFNLNMIEAIEDKNGGLGLWKSIQSVFLNNTAISGEEYILICEDDHQFTEYYNCEVFFKMISAAQEKGADVLMGGVSWFSEVLQVSSDLFWVDKFTGTQFFVVYRRFFDAIANADFKIGDTADRKIASLTGNKFIMYPFISTQKEFGYSDATSKNNEEGYVTSIFNSSLEQLDLLVKVGSYYNLKF